MLDNVLVRASRGKPLHRVAVSAANGLIYVARKESLETKKGSEFNPIGFPEQDIFVFDSDLFQRLEAEWLDKGETAPQSWLTAVRPDAGKAPQGGKNSN